MIPDELLHLLGAAALAFSILTYVILDGTDLGVGILFAANHRDEDRHIMGMSILPIWDGNETWLVLGGGGLIALFPAAYSIFLTATYVPIFLMLFGLIFRAVALEYRDGAATRERRRLFDLVLLGGSVLAAFCQGVVLGALLQGIPHDGQQYSGNGWGWLSGFSLFCGASLVVGYALMGACWLIWRTQGDIQRTARRQARGLAALTLVLLAVAVLWTVQLNASYGERLFHLPVGGSLLVLLALLVVGFHRALTARHEFLPLFAVLGWFIVAFAGILVAVYPMVIPPSLTFAQASSSPSSQSFILLGFAVLIPFTLAYSTYGYWVFRGKVTPRGQDR